METLETVNRMIGERTSRKRTWLRGLALVGVLLAVGCEDQRQVKPQRTPPKETRHAQPPRHREVEEVINPPDPATVWPPKALWMVRRAWRSPDEIASAMEQCRQAGFNTVLFQVRGNATVHYASPYEPWDEEYRGGPPSFDPLAVACTEAHRRGMALHAWVNVMPAWHGDAPPADRRQLYNAHPDWFLHDQRGRRQPLNGRFYASLNPCLPEVREYLVMVFTDIVRRYPVDGLHLDYIRIPLDEAPKGSDYPRDQRTLSLYSQATGKRPEQDKASWNRWRTQQVTQLVWQIRSAVIKTRPGTRLTTACLPDIGFARQDYFQDGPTWLKQSLVDLVFVMNYTESLSAFQRRQSEWLQASGNAWIAPGISLSVPDHKTTKAVADQVRQAQAWGRGLCIFSSTNFFAGDAHGQQCREAIRKALTSSAR